MFYKAIRDRIFSIITWFWARHDNKVLAGQAIPNGLKDMTFNLVELLTKNNSEHQLAFIEKSKYRKFGHVFNVFHLDWEESIKLNDEMLNFLLRY